MAWIAPVVGAVIGIGSAIAGNNEERKAKKNMAKAADIKLQQQDMANAITRRDAVRNLRINYANALAAGTSEPNVSSSVVAGAISSTTSQTTGNLDYFSQQGFLDARFNYYNKKAGKYAQNASTWQTVGQNSAQIAQLGTTIYNSLKN